MLPLEVDDKMTFSKVFCAQCEGKAHLKKSVVTCKLITLASICLQLNCQTDNKTRQTWCTEVSQQNCSKCTSVKMAGAFKCTIESEKLKESVQRFIKSLI